jgi:hypothetical protein
MSQQSLSPSGPLQLSSIVPVARSSKLRVIRPRPSVVIAAAAAWRQWGIVMQQVVRF